MHSTSSIHITPDTELADIVMAYPEAILFLEHFDIYVPFQGKTVAKACAEHQIGNELFIVLLNIYLSNSFNHADGIAFNDIPAIVRYLYNNHRYYLDETYPEIQRYITQISGLNDSDGRRLIEKFFEDYFDEVREHLEYENDVAFPYITNIYDCFRNRKPFPAFGTYSVAQYKERHNDIEEKLDDLMSLLIRYLPHRGDHQLRRKLFHLLVEFNYDLRVHTLIEDLVLVPLVEKLEKQLGTQL